MRGATHHPRSPGGPGNFNPRSPCGERQRIRMVQAAALAISIHAPHAGSDRRLMTMATTKGDFNPRSPCGERRGSKRRKKIRRQFQSTLPMRGATPNFSRFSANSSISIHAPHAGSDTKWRVKIKMLQISIHAPHAGSDLALTRALHKERTISIHAPHAGSDEYFKTAQDRLTISIHAPHAGSDDSAISRATELNNFNPRSPCGERRGILLWGWLPPEFQSTLPMRGATFLRDICGG